MFIKSLTIGCFCTSALWLSTAAYADDTVPIIAPTPINEVNDAVPSDQVSDDALGELRGGQAIVIGNQALNAINSGSIVNGNYTAGNVAITDDAFSNFNGLGNVLINTGALNNLQSAMNVTINFAD